MTFEAEGMVLQLNVLKNKEPRYDMLTTTNIEKEYCKFCKKKLIECLEMKYGQHVVNSTKKYMNEISVKKCSVEDSLVYFKTTLNTLIEFEKSVVASTTEVLGGSIPKCMVQGSLYHCLKWTRWKIISSK